MLIFLRYGINKAIVKAFIYSVSPSISSCGSICTRL